VVTIGEPGQSSEPYHPENAEVLEVFARKASEKLTGHCWWVKCQETLKKWGAPPEEAQAAMSLREAHKYSVVTPEGIAGEYQLYECGNEEGELTDEEMSAIVNTLTLIDQFSSGVMVGSVRTKRIITTAVEASHTRGEV
jgi:hypothetical protein